MTTNELTPNGDNLLGSNTADLVTLSPTDLTNFPSGLATLDGNDTITGSSDSELVMANRGQDNVSGGAGNDTLMGGKDDDTVDGNSGNDVVRGDRDQDIIRGGDGADSLYGGKGHDQLFGTEGNDALYGDRDNDTLTGGAGEDTLTGGAGNDLFILQTAQGLDLITDFENGVDLIQLPSGITVDNIGLQTSGQNTIIVDRITGTTLAQLNNLAANNITINNFVSQTDLTASSENPNFINRVVELTNIERTQLGLSPLTINFQLTSAAQTHSANMALQDFFDHTGLNGSSIGDRVAATGYQYSIVAENIGAGYSTPEEVVAGWMASAGHRENLLDPVLQEIGVGYYFLANETGDVNFNHYWTQAFGS
ncbi:MAG: CAP domain-containing protein [Microcoleaceae cyanobacterium]